MLHVYFCLHHLEHRAKISSHSQHLAKISCLCSHIFVQRKFDVGDPLFNVLSPTSRGYYFELDELFVFCVLKSKFHKSLCNELCSKRMIKDLSYNSRSKENSYVALNTYLTNPRTEGVYSHRNRSMNIVQYSLLF